MQYRVSPKEYQENKRHSSKKRLSFQPFQNIWNGAQTQTTQNIPPD